jgi:hypothetical protein
MVVKTSICWGSVPEPAEFIQRGNGIICLSDQYREAAFGPVYS